MGVVGIQGDQKWPRSGALSWKLSSNLKLLYVPYLGCGYCSGSMKQSILQEQAKAPNDSHVQTTKRHPSFLKSKCDNGIGDLLWPLFSKSLFGSLCCCVQNGPQFVIHNWQNHQAGPTIAQPGFPTAPSYVHPFSCMDDWERMLWPSPPTTSAIDKENMALRWSSLMI